MTSKERRETMMSDEDRIAICKAKGRMCHYCHGKWPVDTVTDRLFLCCRQCADYDNAETIIKTSLPCICCGKEIKPTECCHDETDTISYRSVDGMSFSDGICGKISGGYGSRHDCSSFMIAVCDTCVNQKVQENRLIET